MAESYWTHSPPLRLSCLICKLGIIIANTYWAWTFPGWCAKCLPCTSPLLLTTLHHLCYHYFHLSDGKTEAQRRKVTLSPESTLIHSLPLFPMISDHLARAWCGERHGTKTEDTWALVPVLLPSGCKPVQGHDIWACRFLLCNKFISLLITSSFSFSSSEVDVLHSGMKLQNTTEMTWSNPLFYWFRNWGWGWENDLFKVIKSGSETG